MHVTQELAYPEIEEEKKDLVLMQKRMPCAYAKPNLFFWSETTPLCTIAWCCFWVLAALNQAIISGLSYKWQPFERCSICIAYHVLACDTATSSKKCLEATSSQGNHR